MKYTIVAVLALLILGLGIMAVFAAKTRVAQKSSLQETAQESITQPEGMPVILQEGQTRETYFAKETTMPKKSTKPTKVSATPPLGSGAPIVTASTAPVEAPKLPPETIVVPVVVNVPSQPQPATQTVTTPTAPVAEIPSFPLATLISVIDANTVRILTNKEIQIANTTITGGVTVMSSMQFQDGAQRVWKNTKNPAYLYEITTSPLEKKMPISITITTGTESLTREIQL